MDLTPEQWFDRLTMELWHRQAEIKRFDDYYDGHHPLPPLKEGQEEEFHRLQRLSRSNWCRLVVNTARDNMRVQGLRVGQGVAGQQAGLEAWNRYWIANHLGRLFPRGVQRALTCGRSYLLVWPGPDRRPRITVESPRQMIVAYRPGSQTERAAALKSFTTREGVFQTLWLPGRIYRRQAPAGSYMTGGQFIPWSMPGDPPGPNPYLEGLDANLRGYSDVPVFELAVNANDEGIPASDLADVTPIQDRINLTLLQRVFGSENLSWPIRVLLGAKLRYTEPDEAGNRQPVNILREGPERVNHIPDETARIEQWDAATSDNFIKSTGADVHDLTSISRTPPTVTIAELANIGAESLKALKESHTQKVESHRDVVEDVAGDAVTAAIAMDPDAPVQAETVGLDWYAIDAATLAEEGDYVSKVGPVLPKRTMYERLDYSPQAIEDALAEGDAEDAKNALLNPPPDPTVAPQPQPVP